MGAHHEDIISILRMRYPDLKTTRFAAAMRKHADAYEVEVPRLIPDAWTVTPHPADDRMQLFTVWEVEIARPMDRGKLSSYGKLWGDLDASDAMTDLELIAVDRHGTEKAVNLTEFYYLWLTRGQ